MVKRPMSGFGTTGADPGSGAYRFHVDRPHFSSSKIALLFYLCDSLRWRHGTAWRSCLHQLCTGNFAVLKRRPTRARVNASRQTEPGDPAMPLVAQAACWPGRLAGWRK